MIIRDTKILKECCICFVDDEVLFVNKDDSNIDFEILSVLNIKKELFDNSIVPDNILLESSCKKHYICVQCIKRIVTDYESHPINSENSVIFCPNPFEECVNEIGFRYIIEDRCLEQLLNTEEYREYINYKNQYLFPGFELVKCVGKKFNYTTQSFKECCAEILVPIDDIKKTPKGQMIVNCDQNEECLKSFCYHCKEVVYLTQKCETCTLFNENQNPEAYNRYFNKNKINEDENLKATDDEDTFDSGRIEFPDNFLLKNKEITAEMAIEQLYEIIESHFSYMICCICKTPMYKTEKCNALSHHKIERCYACGRIGDKYIGLGDHWSSTGIGGCPRFMYDSFITYRLKLFLCRENECYNHDLGECHLDEHQDGIKQYNEVRIKSIVLYAIQSLLPDIRYVVYDSLVSKFQNTEFQDYLPYKQTLFLLEKYPSRTCDYSEEIIYEQLGIPHPTISIGNDKTVVLDLQPSQTYSIYSSNSSTIYSPLGISAWRQNFERQRLLLLPEIENLLNTENINNNNQFQQHQDEQQEVDITDVSTLDELTIQLAELGVRVENEENIENDNSFHPYNQLIETYLQEDENDQDENEEREEVYPLLRSYYEKELENQNNETVSSNSSGSGGSSSSGTITDDLLEIITLE